MAGMYRGSFNPGVVEQDFSLRLEPDSLLGSTFPLGRLSRLTGSSAKKVSALTGDLDLSCANLSSVGCALMLQLLKKTSLDESKAKIPDKDL